VHAHSIMVANIPLPSPLSNNWTWLVTPVSI